MQRSNILISALSLISLTLGIWLFNIKAISQVETVSYANNGYHWLNTQTKANSLSADTCKQCHGKIYKEWKKSRHGQAWTNHSFQEGYELETQDRCIYCHAPLKEQYEAIKADRKESLADEGVNCAACHIRDNLIQPIAGKDNDFHMSGLKPQKDMNRLCMQCHQFNLNATVDGNIVPLSLNAQSTYEEWQNYQTGGGAGSCISCHMPKGSHEFHGSYNRDKVINSIDFKFKKREEVVEFSLTNIGAGHCIPTGDVFRNIDLRYAGEVVAEFKRFYKVHVNETDGKISQVLEKNTCLTPGETRLVRTKYIAGGKYQLLYNYIGKHHMGRTRISKDQYQFIISEGLTP